MYREEVLWGAGLYLAGQCFHRCRGRGFLCALRGKVSQPVLPQFREVHELLDQGLKRGSRNVDRTHCYTVFSPNFKLKMPVNIVVMPGRHLCLLVIRCSLCYKNATDSNI